MRSANRAAPHRALPPAATLLLACLSACGGGSDPAPATRRSNVVWLVIDTLRARNLQTYGHERETSPNLARLAERGVVFDKMFSQSSWTKPSVASMLTGLRPSTHGATSGKTTVHLAKGLPTFAETLSRVGYQTAAISENPHISPAIGFAQGFDEFIAREEWQEEWKRTTELARQSVESAIDWMDDRDEARPFHLYVQVLDPHGPWRPLEPYREMFLGDREAPTADTKPANTGPFQEQTGEMKKMPTDEEIAYLLDLYDAELRGVDEALGELIEYLDDEGLMEDTVVVVVSDHGEEFLEHGLLKHGFQVYDESIHVPLFVVGPGVAPGRRDDLLVEHVDLMPTLLELLDVAPMGPLEGTSFAPHLLDPSLPPAEGHGETLSETEFRRTRMRALRTADWKLIENQDEETVELYDLRADPEETKDVAAEHADVVAELRARADALMAARPNVDLTGATGEANSALSDAMRAIGYAGDEEDG